MTGPPEAESWRENEDGDWTAFGIRQDQAADAHGVPLGLGQKCNGQDGCGLIALNGPGGNFTSTVISSKRSRGTPKWLIS
jgi:hypothetical protein